MGSPRHVRCAAVLALVALMVASCERGDGAPPAALPGELHPHASPTVRRVDDGAFVVRPGTARPGDAVGLVWAGPRGVLYLLEQHVDDEWHLRFWLESDAGGGPRAWPAAEWPESVDIGILGPGTDTVEIPEHAAPGSWRICHVGGADPLEASCAPLAIAGRER